MKRIAVAALAVAAALGLNAVVLADAPAEAPKLASVVGQVTKMDGKSLTIITRVDGKSTETVVTVNDATKFFQQPLTAEPNPAEAKLEDLKVGQMVWADYNADRAATLVIMTGKTVKTERQVALEAVLEQGTKGLNLPEGSTLAEWMKAIKDSYPEFLYFIDAAPQINNGNPKFADMQLPDLSSVTSNRALKVRQVLRFVLNASYVTDPRDSLPGKPVPAAFIVTSDYIFISSPGGCEDYEQSYEGALLMNAAFALASRGAEKSPDERELAALLDTETKGFNLPEGATVAEWMKTIQHSYPHFWYFMDPDLQINNGNPKLADMPVPDLSAVISKGTFTIRQVLRAVLNSVKVVDARNIPPGGAMPPTFVIVDDCIFISSPGGCRDKIAPRAK